MILTIIGVREFDINPDIFGRVGSDFKIEGGTVKFNVFKADDDYGILGLCDYYVTPVNIFVAKNFDVSMFEYQA